MEHAPSQPLMRPPLSRFQTPARSRKLAGFFGFGCAASHLVTLITQPTLDWPLFRRPTLSAVDGEKTIFLGR